MTTSTVCRSQTITEVNAALKKCVAISEAYAAQKELITALEANIKALNENIAIKTAMLAKQEIKDTATARVIETYKAEVANLIQQRDLAAATVKKQNKLYRRQKRKTFFVAVAGPALTAAGFIFLKK